MLKKLKTVIFPAIILLLFASSSIFYVALKKSTSDIRGLKQRNTELENENKDLKQKLLLGWKEYIDERNGYKIWYPEELLGFKISVQEKDKDNRLFVFTDQFINTSGSAQPELFRIQTYSKNEPDTTKIIQEDLKEKLEANLNIAEYITQEKINDIDAYKVALPENIIGYYFRKGNLVFILSFDGQSFPPEDSDIIRPYFERMAHYFKFITE